jgi:hypothetical protein
MVLMHELTEMILTQNDGVAWSDIDHWDMEGGGKDSDDPGALPEAPYFLQHARATIIEKALALFMGIDFDEYDEALGELTWQ